MSDPIITAPGAYPNIAAELYHGAEICPAPSISSSGLKTIIQKSPLHYWHGSALNPNRPPESDKAHFSIGKAVHDMLLLNERWPDFYHVVPDGFSPHHHKKWEAELPAYEAAVAAKRTVLKQGDADAVVAMADAVRTNPLARAAITAGEPEMTLAWQDKETGVWLRARPDYLPFSVRTDRAVRAVGDVKTAADASNAAFSRAIATYGYHQSAALYCDGIEAIFGKQPTHWFHTVIEKEAPHVVAVWQLPQEDIDRGRWLNRFAIRAFADCLSKGRWPGYADVSEGQAIPECGLPYWSRKQIDEGSMPEGSAWADAS